MKFTAPLFKVSKNKHTVHTHTKYYSFARPAPMTPHHISLNVASSCGNPASTCAPISELAAPLVAREAIP